MDVDTVLIKTEWLNSGEVFWGSGILIEDSIILTGLDVLSSTTRTAEIISPLMSQFSIDELAALPLKIHVIRNDSSCYTKRVGFGSPNSMTAIPIHVWTSDVLFHRSTKVIKKNYGKPIPGFALLTCLPLELLQGSFLLDTLNHLLELFPFSPFFPDMLVVVQSSPLGMFHRNMLTEGMIVNTLFNNKIFTVDCCLTAASIGGAVFRDMVMNSMKIENLIGMVVIATNCSICINFSHPTCVNINYALVEAYHQILSTKIIPCTFEQEHYSLTSQNSLTEVENNIFNQYTESTNWIVLVKRSIHQGSGVILENFNIVVTCAHVLNFMKDSQCDPVYVILKEQLILGDVLYCAQEDDPIDLAFIKLLDSLEYPGIKMSPTPVILGEMVTAVGIVSDSGYADQNNEGPSYSAGIISCYNTPFTPVTVSCAITGGFSGGAIIRGNQELLAICYGKLYSQEPDFLFPEMSLCIPVSIFFKCCFEYFSTKNIDIFHKIQLLDPISRSNWILPVI